MTLEIYVQAWDRHTDMEELNRLMESQTPSWYLDHQRQYIYKQTIKNLHRFSSTQKDHILSQKWMTTYKHGEYNSKVNKFEPQHNTCGAEATQLSGKAEFIPGC